MLAWRLLGPEQLVTNGSSNCQPQRPQTFIFHLTGPPSPPGSEVPLSPTPAAGGDPESGPSWPLVATSRSLGVVGTLPWAGRELA